MYYGMYGIFTYIFMAKVGKSVGFPLAKISEILTRSAPTIYKWSDMGPAPINGRKQKGFTGLFHPTCRSYFAPVITGFWAHLV